jgi:hypothetical protein
MFRRENSGVARRLRYASGQGERVENDPRGVLQLSQFVPFPAGIEDVCLQTRCIRQLLRDKVRF